MFIIDLIRFFSGYLTVSFSGEFAERLINICAKNRISLWNIKSKNGEFYVNIGIKSFRKLRFLKRKCKVKVKIIKKHGIRFFLNSNKLRFGIAVGLAVYFFTIAYLSSFIWDIEICSDQPIDEKEIVNKLEEMKIREGVRKSSIDSNNQRLELIMNVDDLSWAALNIEGTKLTVDIRVGEKIDKKDNRPSNLIAAKDAVVKRIFVTSGQTLVSTDQTVLKGEILVSGIIEDKMGKTSLKHSSGEIFAITKESISITVPYEQKKKIQTGKKDKRTVISFFGIKIPLFIGSVKFENNKQITNKRSCVLGKKLPISLITTTFYETKDVISYIDENKAIELAKEQFKQKICEKNYVSYEIIDTKIFENSDSVIVTFTVSGEENIAEQEILSINTTN